MVKFIAVMLLIFLLAPQLVGTLSRLGSGTAPPAAPAPLTEVDRPSCHFTAIFSAPDNAGRFENMGVDRDGGSTCTSGMSWYPNTDACYAAWYAQCVDLRTAAGHDVRALQYVANTLHYQAQFAANPDPTVDPTFNCHGFTFASALGRYWINDPSVILADLYRPIAPGERRPGDVVVFDAGGVPVHSAKLESLGTEPWLDTVVNKPGKNPMVIRQLRGPGPGDRFAWQDAARVTYYRYRGG